MNNKSLLYIIILLIICFLVMGSSDIISKEILGVVKEEMFPVDKMSEDSGNELIDELFPAFEARKQYINDVKYSVSNDLQDVVISTSLDSQLVDNQENISGENIVCDDMASNDIVIEEVAPVISMEQSNSLLDVGINYSMEQLSNFEFLISNCYTVDGTTSVTSKDINVENMLAQDLSIDLSDGEYKVLVYHTHGSEAFIDSRPGVSEDTIIGVGDELTRILQDDYGINTYHDRTVYDVVDGKLDRDYAYTQSGNGIDKILAENPSIEVILDVHRDGVRDEVHLMKVIDGKPTAQIMFFNGVSRLNEEGDLGYLHNPNLATNLSFSLQMHLKGKALYGDLMRKIYIGGYCYNLDRKPRASLIEVGAQNNTVEEAKNAMIPLAAILYSVLSGN